MKTIFYSILYSILIFGFTAAGFCQPAQQDPDFGTYYTRKKTLFEVLPNGSEEIIFLGDSITDSNEWAELFGSMRLKNRGISGDVTAGVLYRLQEVTESDPKQVFIMIGVNDLARDVPVETVVDNYGKIINQIQQESPATEIYVQSILPVNEDFPQFASHTNKTQQIKQANRRLKELAGQEEVTFINLFDDFSTKGGKLKPEYTEDGLHLNGPGYLVWKSVIRPYLDL